MDSSRPPFLFRDQASGWRRRTMAGALRLRPPIADQYPESNRVVHEAAVNARIAVEIGGFEGGGSITIRHAMEPGGTLYVVDPYPRNRYGWCNALITAKRQARKQRRVKTIFLRCRSLEAAQGWHGPPIDLLVIDGQHRAEAIVADWRAWEPHLAPGARVIASNDVVQSRAEAGDRNAALLHAAAANPGGWRVLAEGGHFTAFELADA